MKPAGSLKYAKYISNVYSFYFLLKHNAFGFETVQGTGREMPGKNKNYKRPRGSVKQIHQMREKKEIIRRSGLHKVVGCTFHDGITLFT